MKFADPIYLIVGAIITIALIVLRIWLTKRNQRELTRFAAARLIPRLTQGISTPRRQAKATLFILGVAFLFIALARPQWGTTREEVRMQGIDILIALDTSRSMLASDVSPNRLERSKLAIHDFTTSLEAARIGLLPFAGDAFLLCPLTLDRSAFESSLNDLDTRIIPEGGTDIARAIKESEKVFEKGANHKILILITDGEDLEGGALDAARDAQKNGITIHTVGVGTPSGNLILLDNGRPLTDASGKAVQSKLDDKTLREIAQITAGMYAPLIGDTAGLEQIRDKKLDQVAKSELESQTKEIPIERYQWPLGLGLILLALEFCISAATRNKKTQAATQATIMALAFLTIATPTKASESTIDPRTIYNEGTQLWKEGKFSEAEQKFHDSLNNADLPLQTRAYYNMGNTRYRQGQQSQQKDAKKTIQLWEKSIKSYEDALKLDPDDQDAAFNKKLVQKQLDELKKQEEQKKNQDKKDQDKKDQKDQNKDQKDKEDQKDDQKQKDKDDKKEDEQKKEDSKSGEENKDQEKQEGKEDGKDEKDPQQDKEQQQGKEPGKEDADEKDAQTKPDSSEKPSSSEESKDGNPQEKGDQQATPTEAQAIPDQMTKEQAKRLLESLTAEEGKIRVAIPRRSDKKGRPQRPKRDW